MAVWRRSSSALATAFGVGFVDEDEVAERLAQQRRHDAIGFGEGLGHDRLGRAQRLQHVHVLRALAGVQERHLGRGAVAAEDALRAQAFQIAGWLAASALSALADFVRQFGGVGIVDGQAFGRAQVRFGRRGRGRGAARLGGFLTARRRSAARPRKRRRSPARRAEELCTNCRRGSARLSLASRFSGIHVAALFADAAGDLADRDRSLAVAVQPVRNVLLEHDMEIGAAKSKGAHTGAPHAIRRHRPRSQFGVDVKRGVGEVDIRDWDARNARWAAAPCRAAPGRFSAIPRRRRRL